MINVDRSLRARTSPSAVRTRHRFHAITAGVAMAFVAGLSAPAVAAAADNPVSAVNTAAETSVGALGDAGGTTEMSKTEAIAASAIAKLTGETPASAAAAKGSDTATPAQKHTAKKPAQKSAKKATAPTKKQLHPRGIPGGQESFRPSNEQLKNAREIVKAGQKMNLPPRAQVIAVATAMQESTLKNLGHLGDRNDHDSQGLFQQRPSSGWGTPKQITNPQYAATSFYKGLVNVDGWESMPLTGAAQAVQVSAFPDHYAKWEKEAGELVLAFYGEGPYAKQAAALK